MGILGNAHILVCCTIISYQRIEVYKVETMYMGGFHWNSGVSGNEIPVSTILLIVKGDIF